MLRWLFVVPELCCVAFVNILQKYEDALFPTTVWNKMTMNLNMLCLVMVYGIVSNPDSTLIITENSHFVTRDANIF